MSKDVNKPSKSGNVPRGRTCHGPRQSNGLRWSVLISEISHLEGGILTILDAIFPSESQQGKAVKDLIRQTFWRSEDRIRDMCFGDKPVPEFHPEVIAAESVIISRERAKSLGIDVDAIEKEAESVANTFTAHGNNGPAPRA